MCNCCAWLAGSDGIPRHNAGQVLRHRAQHHHRDASSQPLGAAGQREGTAAALLVLHAFLELAPVGAAPGKSKLLSGKVRLGPESSCRVRASAGLAEIVVVQTAQQGWHDNQPDEGDTEKQQIPPLWCLLIVGIKGKKKIFLPFTLLWFGLWFANCRALCPLERNRPSAFTFLGGNLCCPPCWATAAGLGSCSCSHSQH